MDKKIILRNISKVYQKGKVKVEALRSINLEIDEGEFVAIMGPSGSGKTTLLNIIGCLDTPTEGEVIYNGQLLKNLTEDLLAEYRKKNIGFIFQHSNLIPVLTVKENIELPLVIDKFFDFKEKEVRIKELIEKIGLKDMEDRFPAELSGGQEQRVAIARALIKKPFVVLADEPTANLDSQSAIDIIQIMRDMNETEKITFIFSTHDPKIEKFAKRIIILKDGVIYSDTKI
ncbi:MAG: ABC transporter ATP-binding protein [Endomicrobia bacterium]|nr:ABC transporter ATP-binding protein [Endomicrobiia bacterium]